MSNYLNIDVPVFSAYVDNAFFYNEEPKSSNPRTLVEVFGYTSIPQRCGLFSIMTEYGSQHARVPIHYLHSIQNGGTNYSLDWIQLWDSLSYYVSVNINQYTKNRAANLLLKNKTIEKAQYMFTLDWCLGPQYNNGYGEMAGGHKCGHVFVGDGQYFIQPNNRIFWLDGGSFISRKFDTKPHWKVFSKEFSCEYSGNKWISESNEELWFYEFKEKMD
jgi:hypothetical protein